MHILKNKISDKTIISIIVTLCLLAVIGILIDRQWSINAGLVCWIIVVGGIPIGFLVRWAFEKRRLQIERRRSDESSDVEFFMIRSGEVSADEFVIPTDASEESWPKFSET